MYFFLQNKNVEMNSYNGKSQKCGCSYLAVPQAHRHGCETRDSGMLSSSEDQIKFMNLRCVSQLPSHDKEPECTTICTFIHSTQQQCRLTKIAHTQNKPVSNLERKTHTFAVIQTYFSLVHIKTYSNNKIMDKT